MKKIYIFLWLLCPLFTIAQGVKKVGKYADVNGIKIYYETYGQGQPLIVLHDFQTSLASLSIYYEELMKKYQVILVDMRGQDYAIPLNKDVPLTCETMASDINQLMEQLKIDSAHIWGIQLGAKVGLLMAKDYPKKVKKLLAFGLYIKTDSTSLIPLSLKRYEDMSNQTSDYFAKRVADLLLAFNMPFSELSTIKAPVLLIGADKGTIVKEHTLKISRSLPNGQFCYLPGTPFDIINKKTDLFLLIMKNFFDE
jgi:hypothetical protein